MNWITVFVNWLFGYKDNSKLIAQIQSATVKACGFLPYVETVAKLLSANPGVATATIIANKICGALNKPAVLGIMGQVPMVDGVMIEGEFVTQKEKKNG